MDRDEKIIINILELAQKGILSKRKFRHCGCKTEEEMQTFLDVLVVEKLLHKKQLPPNVARDGHGRELIRVENEPDYFITSAGKEYLAVNKEGI